MKITELQLTNFINHAETKIDFARVNVFVGPNGAGKTTILNGIEWTLTGSCRGMAKKKDAAGIIKHGAKSAGAWLKFEKNGEGPAYYIDRRCTPSNTTLVFGQGEKVIARGLQEAQEKIYEVLGITAEIANVLFDVFALPQLTNVERKKIIQSVVASEGTEALADYLEEKGFGNMPKDHLDAIIKAYQDHGLGSDSKGSYGYAVQMRRDYKRQLGEIPKSEPPTVGDGGDLKGMSADNLKSALDDRMQQREAMLRTQAYDAGQVDATKESIRLMEEEIAKVNKQIEEMGDVESPVESAERDLAESEVAITKVIDKENEGGGTRFNVQTTLDTLAEMGDAISQKSMKAVSAKFNLIEEESDSGAAEHLSDLEACEKAVAAAKQALTTAKGLWIEMSRLVSMNEQNNRILEGLKADLANAESQKDTGLSPEQLATKLDTLETDIVLYQTRLEQLTRYDEYLRSIEGVKKQEKALAAKQASWDKLAEALNPKNPDVKVLMGDTFETFQELFSSASRALGVPSTVNDEDFSIEAFPDGRKSPVAWLSHSEVYRVGIALEMALCAILGIRTAIIDKGETLFEECKQDLSRLISAPSNYIDCFLVLATGGLNTNCSDCDDVNDKQLPGDRCKACEQGIRKIIGPLPEGVQLRGVKDGKML